MQRNGEKTETAEEKIGEDARYTGPPDSQGRKVEGLLPRTERSLPDLADPRNSISHKKGELLKRFSFFVTIFIQNIAQYEKTDITDPGLVYGLRLR